MSVREATERPTRPTRPAAGPPVGMNTDVRRTLLAAAAVVLGMLTINGLISDRGWLVDAVLTIAVVIVPTAVIRLRRRPGAFDVWLGVVLLVPWLTLRFVPDHAVLHLIPTPSTVHDISRLMTDLHHTTATEPAPVHSTPAIRLVLCALVGLVAALVDLIAVVGRRSALAGIPLLIVYTVSGAVSRHAVPWVWFALAAAGFLLLLSLDAAERRSGWGHQVSLGGRGNGGGAAVARSRTGPLLGAVAVLIAVLVPFVVPLPTDNLLADALRGGSGNGLGQFGAGDGDGGSITPFANLRGQLVRGKAVDLMTVHVDSTDRSRQVPFYLRTNILDDYTAAGWQVSDHGAGQDITDTSLDTAPGNEQPAATRFTVNIKISGLTSNPPVFTRLREVHHVRGGTSWSPQDQLLLGPAVPSDTTIEESFDQADPSAQDLADAPTPRTDGLQRWLAKPQLPATVVSLVNRLTAGTTGPYAAARAISNYFADPANGFVYSLSTAPADSSSALVDFLNNKEGYCQQYAAAMAIMLRQADVPSRVVLGYMHDAPDAKGNFTVTSHDAHSWVEAYFEGIGWIPFDPTPIAGLAGGASSDLAWAPHAYPGVTNRDPVAPKESASAPDAAPAPSTSAATQPTTTAAPDSNSVDPALPLTVASLALLVIVVALAPAAVRTGRRRRRWTAARTGDASALWQELTDTALDLGYVWSPSRSPRQVADRLARDAGTAAPSLHTLAGLVERQRYARTGSTSLIGVADLVEPIRRVIATLRHDRGRRTRVLSRVWPASLNLRVRDRLRRH